jgi:PKD repeat protein
MLERFKKLRTTTKKIVEYVPKKVLVSFAVLTAVLVPLAVSAWGPSRPIYCIQGSPIACPVSNPAGQAADHVTFNSIANNPAHGDERNFMRIKESNASNTTYRDSITVQPGGTYDILMYYHNNADASLNNSGVGIANGVKMRAALPSQVGNTDTKAVGDVLANNSTPAQVWDDITVKSSGPQVALRLVPGSARLYNHNDGHGNASKVTALPDEIATPNGTLIGYDLDSNGNVKLDGVIKGCAEYSGYVILQVRAESNEPDPDPDPDPVYTCDALAINGVSRTRFELTNTHTARDGATYRNTTYTVTDPDGHTTTHTESGPYVYENTKVGRYTVVATTNFDVNGQTQSVTSNGCRGEFEVEAEPMDPVDPVYTCDVLNIAKTSRTTFQFTTNYTVRDTTYLNVTYTISGPNTNDTRVSNAENGGLYYNQNRPGTYTVTALLKTAAGDNTSAGCAKTFVVEPEPVPAEAVCRILTADKTAIKTGQTVNFRVYPEYRGNVTVNSTWMDFGDDETTDPLNVVNYAHTYTTAGTYTAQAYINFTVDGTDTDNITSTNCRLPISVTDDDDEKCTVPGKEDLDKDDPNCRPDPEMCDVPGLENLPKNDPRCRLPEDKCRVPGKEYLPANDPRCVSDTIDHCKIPGKEYLPANDPGCVSNPPTTPAASTTPPSQLPATGGELFSALGLGSVITAAGYFMASRKQLGKV